MYMLENFKLRKMFTASNYKICITINMWISIQNINYICITIHFIDDNWMFHKRIIGFMKVPDHKGTNIGREKKLSILRCGIKKYLQLQLTILPLIVRQSII